MSTEYRYYQSLEDNCIVRYSENEVAKADVIGVYFIPRLNGDVPFSNLYDNNEEYMEAKESDFYNACIPIKQKIDEIFSNAKPVDY